jgi:hypothetical protein
MKLKRYMFSFEGGGWNIVWAKTLKGARKEMMSKYGVYNPIPNSIHLATEEGVEVAMMNFW